MKIIPFNNLRLRYSYIRKKIDDQIKKNIDDGQFIGGIEVEKFERNFSIYLNAKYTITVNSGTDALILGIQGLNFNSNDEIIVPVNTFIATALSVLKNGLKPIFVDIDNNDYGINLDDLKDKINSRTKAIILVHLYGQPEKIDDVKKIIKKSGKRIQLIEDACQAHGAIYKTSRVGNFGIFSAFSFYPTKNLGAFGDGGAIVTNDIKLAKKYRFLKDYGQKTKYIYETSGINSRLDALQAGILNIELQYLDQWNSNRRRLAHYYTNAINKKLPFIFTPKEFPQRKHVYHTYIVRAPRRNQLLHFLEKNGINCLIHYPIPLHLQKAYYHLNYAKGDFPFAEKISKEILSLPMYEYMSTEQIDFIVKKIKDFYKDV